ncbi:hypothetical protein [Bifidobacterium psychraerophilum]|jgi:MFS family permease|uniref:hypothetical protein n=1 Tax=Bifidobacterium psychraerophilum TaxID=218140 RepID=UPI0023EFE758|nr:hypothetical protein [Bifidobacterium psychraerophilum]MCI1660376.1 hypothetical protein [Bifidobacterium psychraerophilum]MCI1804129.1 hypothetical protein [Bifidobacterium psychraerophilum]MCI2176511.1 hypothetical protein [Bifidobacterium psychraerophilum]MCI2182027.1 hypothetical protein [Bifidobacterium psychraerophilum]
MLFTFTEEMLVILDRLRTPDSLINFGVAGIQYIIRLHLINIGTQPFCIGLMNTGVCAGMLIGSVLANRLSDKVHVGATMCAAFVTTVVFVIPMLFGFVFSKTDEHLQGRVATVISAPAQVLSMFCSGIAGSLLLAAGFTMTAGFFLAALVASALIAALTLAITTIPAADEWEHTQL